MPLPVVSPYVGQEFTCSYLSINDNLMTEVQSIRVTRTDGGSDVETLVRDYAGRVKGAAKATINISGVVPYLPPDTGGAAFASGGMVAGGGVQLDATMLTSLNQNGNQPIKFVVAVGQPAAQQLVFKGYISEVVVDTAVGKQTNFSLTASGTFALFG